MILILNEIKSTAQFTKRSMHRLSLLTFSISLGLLRPVLNEHSFFCDEKITPITVQFQTRRTKFFFRMPLEKSTLFTIQSLKPNQNLKFKQVHSIHHRWPMSVGKPNHKEETLANGTISS